MKQDLIERASAQLQAAARRTPGDPTVELAQELLDALLQHQQEATRALWSVVKAQGGYARVPKLFITAMGAEDRLEAKVEASGEAIIYRAISGG